MGLLHQHDVIMTSAVNQPVDWVKQTGGVGQCQSAVQSALTGSKLTSRQGQRAHLSMSHVFNKLFKTV